MAKLTLDTDKYVIAYTTRPQLQLDEYIHLMIPPAVIAAAISAAFDYIQKRRFEAWQRVSPRLGSGLLILIISSGRDPFHGPAVADRISWSVLGYQCGALGLWCCFEYGSRFSQPGNRNYSYWGIGVLVDVRTVKKLGLAQ